MRFKTKIEENDTKEIVNSEFVNIDFYKNSTILITGATGLIGKQVVNSLLYANEFKQANITIVALVRNQKKAQDIFGQNKTNKLNFLVQDITKPLKTKFKVDYIIHTANSTSSKSFVETPVETINSIVLGTKNTLEFARKNKVKGIVYLSSMEVFGNTDTNRVEPLKETDYGYINLAKVRNSYPEGKRLAEAMCVSYSHEYNVPVKVARLAQTIGAGVDYNDGRIFAEFARCIVEKRDITLKTEGKTIRSYLYITDCVSAIFSMLEKGKNGEIYNIANSETTCSIKEMAEMLCQLYTSSKLVFNLDDKYYPDTTKYYLDTTKCYLDTTWRATVSLEEMFHRLISSFYYSLNTIIETTQKRRDYSKDTFWEQIFSLKNHQCYKVVKILGIPINIDRSLFAQKYYNLPIQKNKIVLINFGGNGYGCNPKYIAEELLKRGENYDLVWLAKKSVNTNDVPKAIRVVNFSKKEAIREIITAKYIISNVRLNKLIERGWHKRAGQYYIQTWHGSLGIKKIDANVKGKVFTQRTWCTTAKIDSQYTTTLISNSQFENSVFKNGFWYKGNIALVGHPRNDIFFYDKNKLDNIKKKVYQDLDIPTNNRIFLYVPSFRDDYRLDCYMLDTDKLKETLSQKFGGIWTILIRMHPRLVNVSHKLFNYNNSTINASFYSDIQELLESADIAVTDYSSCIFDFMLTRKPAFIFATDIKKYNTERGFYYPLESTPFPVAKNNEELIKNIENFDLQKYQKDVEQFLLDKGCIEDGHAAERVVDLIENATKGELNVK